MKIFKLVIITACIFTVNNVFGQNDSDMVFKSARVKKTTAISSSIDKYVHETSTNAKLVITAQKLDENFTGYTIRIKASQNTILSSNDKIFKEFGKIRVHQDGNNNFIYLVGQFEKEKIAHEYLLKIVAARYPLASVVQYEEGKIVLPFAQNN